MKIQFDKTGHDYLEVKKQSEDKVLIVLSAKDGTNSKKTITNSVKIDLKDFIAIYKEITK